MKGSLPGPEKMSFLFFLWAFVQQHPTTEGVIHVATTAQTGKKNKIKAFYFKIEGCIVNKRNVTRKC